MVISGLCLTLAFSDAQLTDLLMQVLDKSTSLVAFRCSPEEKAQLIKNIMRHDPNAFTLAIGDGANDVNMIQSAHTGVGLLGKEGS